MSEVTVDPTQIPKKMTFEELEYFVLFAICVAGKGATQMRKKLNEFLNANHPTDWWSPFTIVKIIDLTPGRLKEELQKHKMGQYKRIEKAFREVVKLDVMKDLAVEKLEAIPGIGPKTARFIVLYTNPEADCVPLDTHILKYLAKEFPECRVVPKSTPSKGKLYNYLEDLFRLRAKELGKSVRQLDTEVWQSYARA